MQKIKKSHFNIQEATLSTGEIKYKGDKQAGIKTYGSLCNSEDLISGYKSTQRAFCNYKPIRKSIQEE